MTTSSLFHTAVRLLVCDATAADNSSSVKSVCVLFKATDAARCDHNSKNSDHIKTVTFSDKKRKKRLKFVRFMFIKVCHMINDKHENNYNINDVVNMHPSHKRRRQIHPS